MFLLHTDPKKLDENNLTFWGTVRSKNVFLM